MIERLYVHNYRCLENFTLDLTGQPSAALIGKNGSGKSTVLHALRVLQGICRGPNRVKNVVTASDFPWGRKDLPMRFEVDIVLADKRKNSIGERRFKYSVAFEWPQEFFEARILEESLTADGIEVFSRQHSQVKLAGGAAFGLDWHVFALPVINEKPPARSIQEVKAFFSSMIVVAPIPQKIKGFTAEPVSELDWGGQDLASCLRALLQQKPKSYTEFDRYIRNAIPDFSSIEFLDRGEEGGSQLSVTFEQSKSGKTVPLDFGVLSDGEKCFMLSGYVVAANAVGPPVVCVWDEPDNHLSLSEVGHFIAAMRRMTNEGGQFIATTHHPEALRKFSDENTFVLTRKSHLEPTVIKPLSAYSYSGDLVHALVRDEIIG